MPTVADALFLGYLKSQMPVDHQPWTRLLIRLHNKMTLLSIPILCQQRTYQVSQRIKDPLEGRKIDR